MVGYDTCSMITLDPQEYLPTRMPSVEFKSSPKQFGKQFLQYVAIIFVVGAGSWQWGSARTIWLVLALIAVMGAVFLYRILLKPGYVRLSASGFEYGGPKGVTSYRWNEVEGIGVIRPKGPMGSFAEFVGFNVAPESARAGSGSASIKKLTGFDQALPENYGFTVEGLSMLMNTWHAEHTKAS